MWHRPDESFSPRTPKDVTPLGGTNTKKALAKNASASSFVAGRRIELRTS